MPICSTVSSLESTDFMHGDSTIISCDEL